MTKSEYVDKEILNLVAELKNNGINNKEILIALKKTPRSFFVENSIRTKSNLNIALPIECGQTISQPQVVAKMTQCLELSKKLRVLEIGTGSGYQTAILAKLARFVYTIERYKTLKFSAELKFKKLNLNNVFCKHADGGMGWVEQMPFERIIVTASAPEIPKVLLNQLSNNGIMLVPIGEENNNQSLIKITRYGDKFLKSKIMNVRFVPLLEGKENK